MSSGSGGAAAASHWSAWTRRCGSSPGPHPAHIDLPIVLGRRLRHQRQIHGDGCCLLQRPCDSTAHKESVITDFRARSGRLQLLRVLLRARCVSCQGDTAFPVSFPGTSRVGSASPQSHLQLQPDRTPTGPPAAADTPQAAAAAAAVMSATRADCRTERQEVTGRQAQDWQS